MSKKFVLIERVSGAVHPSLQLPLEDLLKQAAVSEIIAERHAFSHHQQKRGFEVIQASYNPSLRSFRTKCFLSGGEGQSFFVVIGKDYEHNAEIIQNVVTYIEVDL